MDNNRDNSFKNMSKTQGIVLEQENPRREAGVLKQEIVLSKQDTGYSFNVRLEFSDEPREKEDIEEIRDVLKKQYLEKILKRKLEKIG